MPSDYISKSALMKQFTVSPSGERYRLHDCDGFPCRVDLKDIQDAIRNAPTLDLAPAPVKCEKCEYSLKRGDLIFCKAGIPSIYEDFYCANGKRKEQE